MALQMTDPRLIIAVVVLVPAILGGSMNALCAYWYHHRKAPRWVLVEEYSKGFFITGGGAFALFFVYAVGDAIWRALVFYIRSGA
jgi:hypothetical protein